MNSLSDKEITANELKKSLDANPDLFLLDVREPDEFADWNIEGSHNIPLGESIKVIRPDTFE